jgi:hypothetical protein
MVRTVIPRGHNHSLQVTLCLVLEEWPRVGISPGSTIRDNYSSRADSFSPGYTFLSVGRMAQGGNSPGQSFLRADSFPPVYTFLSVRGVAQGKEWSKHFSRVDSFSLGYTLFSVRGMV